MIFKTTCSGVVVEVSSGHLFVKLGRHEVFVRFARDGGPAGRRVVFSKA